MSDIFISYQSQDRARAQTLAQALAQHGWSVWWDRTIPSGKRFDQVIPEALADARCVVVLWSKQSVVSDWVLEEAEEGRRRQILVPVLIEDVLPPMGFRRIQAADLMGWDGEGTSPAFQKLVADIAAILGPPTTKTRQEKRRRAKGKAVAKRTLASGTLIEPRVVLPPKEKPEERIPGIRGMVKIPAGEFLYGDKKEKHSLAEYYIDIYPVTNAEYKRFVGAGGYDKQEYWTAEGWRWIQKEGHKEPIFWDRKAYKAFNRPDHPVVGVSWYEAWAYAKWAGKRLPTELEWEKAARGVDGREYPWGDAFDSSRCNMAESEIRSTTPVMRYDTGKSPYGCYDMAGNVWEWTNTLYKPYPYKADDGREDPNSTGLRVLRGSSWRSGTYGSSFRSWYDPENTWLDTLGFRCAKTP